MDNYVFNKDYIFLNVNLKTKQEVFEFIASKAKELKIVTSKKALIDGFKLREAENTTGFEDGFAIPHPKDVKQIKKPAVFVLRFTNPIEWNALDNKPIEIAIALLTPQTTDENNSHLTLLSQVAVKLTNQEFKTALKQAKTKKEILNILNSDQNIEIKKENNNLENTKQLKIVAVTSCTVGIAHTYMAEEKLLQQALKQNYQIRVETQGSKGIGTPLTNKEIKEADVVIIATDTAVDLTRFTGKKVYKTKVSNAIKDPEKTINDALKLATIHNQTSQEFETKNIKNQEKVGVLQHILSGISYMVPIIILGGICLAVSLGLAKAIYGADAAPKGFLKYLEAIGGASFTLMIAILGGFIANSIAGRAAIVPAMVGSFIGNNPSNFANWIPGLGQIQTPMGFVGAIIAGLIVGYFVKWVNSWKVPKTLAPAMPIFFIPLVGGIGISFIFIFVLGAPIGFIMNHISSWIKSAYIGQTSVWIGLALGIILGAMAGFDMGGPVNKIAFVTCSALITEKIYEPMGAMAAAIPVAPLGMGLTTLLFKKFFNSTERQLGVAALIMGSIGISEGAIPFAIRDPRRAILCNVVGSAVAGGVAGSLKVQDFAAHGGPIVWVLGAVPYGIQSLYFFIAVLIGVIVTSLMYGFWMVQESGKLGSVREAYVWSLIQTKKAKSEFINEKKQEIKDIKNNTKNKNLSEEQINQIQNINDQITNYINEYKTKLKQLKQSYLNLNKEEKTFMNNKKSEISDYKKQTHSKYNQQISDLKQNNNLESKQLNKEIKNLKTKEKQDIIDYSKNLRNQFSNKFKMINNL
ncbi:PTS fructose transporter subunit IIABC [Mycoplasma mycoides]|uniref:PTS fructose transporter subunit IIABC n=1 Tax=Mycoplasma mycoides TaxID=2102 RepID=UPI00223EDD29|nr:fructose-specific PTS transporter subunit EIIC [Mycoplasma mycoides]QVK09077.1 PTS sugar transporter subunit IIA [Mycoplasma mycoides subsp. capri]